MVYKKEKIQTKPPGYTRGPKKTYTVTSTYTSASVLECVVVVVIIYIYIYNMYQLII